VYPERFCLVSDVVNMDRQVCLSVGRGSSIFFGIAYHDYFFSTVCGHEINIVSQGLGSKASFYPYSGRFLRKLSLESTRPQCFSINLPVNS